MDLSTPLPSNNAYIQSSGPCVVCDGSLLHQHQHAECLTVHPSCLSRVSSSPASGADTEHVSTSSSTSSFSSSTISDLPDVAKLGPCSNCNCSQLQAPHIFPRTLNDDDDSYISSDPSQICYGCSMDMLGCDFGSLETGDHATATTENWPTGSPEPVIICASCQQPKDALDFSSFMSMSLASESEAAAAAICNRCIPIKISSEEEHQQYYSTGSSFDRNSTEYNAGSRMDTIRNDGSTYYCSLPSWIDENNTDNTSIDTLLCHGLPQLETLTIGLPSNDSGSSNTYSNKGYISQPLDGTNAATTTNRTVSQQQQQQPPRTRRKQTRRPKTGSATEATDRSQSSSSSSSASSSSTITATLTAPNDGYNYITPRTTTAVAVAVEQEPVIQWISRREPLPPNVCSRCRCRYVRPGKKQCQHCAYDYRGTRDHRASMGLCITCAEPLDRDHDYYLPLPMVVAVAPPSNQYHGLGGAAVGGRQNVTLGGGGVGVGGNCESGGTVGGGGGGVKPRRSCKACREKNRLKKAADKAARLKMMAAGGGGEGKMGC